MKKLHPVYAIEVMPGVFLPRNKDSDLSSKEPKLFVRRFDCNRALKSQLKTCKQARIVVFELVPVRQLDPGQPVEVGLSDPIDATV